MGSCYEVNAVAFWAFLALVLGVTGWLSWTLHRERGESAELLAAAATAYLALWKRNRELKDELEQERKRGK